MKLNDFDYNLPDELIATEPATPRDSARLLVLDKKTGQIMHRHFFDLVDYLKQGDVLVVNDSKVFPARLLGQKENSGGKVELLLNKELKPGIWEALGKNVKEGNAVVFEGSVLRAEVMKKYEETCEVRFNTSGTEFFSELEKIGHTPLPPYIKRSDSEVDKKAYQTVYANKIGSAAAPTAGLHFTEDLLHELKSKGVIVASVTLNVGLGTFAPVKTDEIEDHEIHSEYFSITEESAATIINAKKEGRRVIAVGTTSTRVLEHLFSLSTFNLQPDNYSGWTNIFIYPGYMFKCVDAIITNFHLPKSTLLMLVSAFSGKKNIDAAYKEAVLQKYRFYSYGDAMLLI